MKLTLAQPNEIRRDHPPLPLVSIVTYIKKYGGHTDANMIDTTFDEALEKIKAEKPDVIGLSAYTIHYPQIIKLAHKIRETDSLKNSIIILGGAHITSRPNSLKSVFDVGVVGEGEDTMLELMNLFKEKGMVVKKDLRDIKGIVFFEDGKLVETPIRELVDLSKIPILDWSMVDKSYFKKNLTYTNKPVVSMQIMTSRGCPFKCIFCNSTANWRKIRFQSPKIVADEIELLYRKFNVRLVVFLDDLFTINKRRLREIIEELRERKILGKIEFQCMARSNTINDELMELLKELRVTTLTFGFESGNDRMIKYLKGGSVSLEAHQRAARLCKKYGIKVKACLIFGSPGESIDEMKDTLKFIDFLMKNNVEQVFPVVMSPLPNTLIWEIAKKRGKVSEDMDWEKLTLFDSNEPLLLDEDISKEEFWKVFKKASAKSKYLDIKVWIDKLIHSPFTTIFYLASHPEFMKLFLMKK